MAAPATLVSRAKQDDNRVDVKKNVASSSVTIIVGNEAQNFLMKRQVLCERSTYFDKAFSSTFVEGESGVCTLPDVPAGVFQIFTSWLVSRRVTYPSDDGDDDMPDSFLNSSTDTTSNGENKTRKPKRQRQEPISWSWRLLFDIYIFADRFDVRKLRGDVLDIIMEKIQQTPRCQESEELIKAIPYALDNVPHSSPLRLGLVHIVAYYIRFDDADEDDEYLPRDFLFDVLRVCTHRLPAEVCKRCFDKAKDHCQKRSYKPETCLIHSHLEDQDQLPFSANRCIYHEHISKRERKVCRKKAQKQAGR